MTEQDELEFLRVEVERLKRENTGLRSQLYFLREGSLDAMDKATARRMSVNGNGQFFCPACHSCVWEPPNIPSYWRRCQYANKEPPTHCPQCGQRLMKDARDQARSQFEEDSIKIQHKGEQSNGNWYHRR